jgi:ribosomal-protein-alanine N-acetyltransferase
VIVSSAVPPRWRIERVGAVHAAVLAALHGEAGFERGWTAAEFAALLATPGVVATIALEAENVEARPPAPAAFLLTRRAADEAEILTLATLPAGRRRGAARALVREAAARLAAERVQTLWLEAAESNAAALALYRGVGFAPAGRRPGYYSTGPQTREDALVLQLDLGDRGQ